MKAEDMVKFGQAWNDLGWAISEQVRDVVLDPQADANPAAVRQALRNLELVDGAAGICLLLRRWLRQYQA